MQSSQSAAAPDRSAQNAESRTILMVEDDATVMAVGTAILLDCGHEVISACSAADALAAVRGGQSFDLLFSDIVMPGEMNGVALAGEIHRLRPGVPILLTSGWADPGRDMADRDQSYAFIGKPYRQADLARKIQLLFADHDAQP